MTNTMTTDAVQMMTDSEVLKLFGFSPQKAAEIKLDADRGDAYALRVVMLARQSPLDKSTSSSDKGNINTMTFTPDPMLLNAHTFPTYNQAFAHLRKHCDNDFLSMTGVQWFILAQPNRTFTSCVKLPIGMHHYASAISAHDIEVIL